MHVKLVIIFENFELRNRVWQLRRNDNFNGEKSRYGQKVSKTHLKYERELNKNKDKTVKGYNFNISKNSVSLFFFNQNLTYYIYIYILFYCFFNEENKRYLQMIYEIK